MTDIKLLLLHSDTINYLTLYKQTINWKQKNSFKIEKYLKPFNYKNELV